MTQPKAPAPKWPPALLRVIHERDQARADLKTARDELAQCLGFIRTEVPSARGTIEHLMLVLSALDGQG